MAKKNNQAMMPEDPSLTSFKSFTKEVAGLTLQEHTEMLHRIQQVSFYAFGAHLYAVQFHQKYKDAFGTLEEWAESEFGITRQRVYEYIDGYKIVNELAKFNPPFLPANDYQARQLKGLDLDSLRECWIQVTDNMDGSTKITAAGIKRIADQYRKEDAAYARDDKKRKSEQLAEDAEYYDPNEPAFDVPPVPNHQFDGDGTTRLGPNTPPPPVTYVAEDPQVIIYARRFFEILRNDGNLDANLVQDIAMKMIELGADL